MRKGKRESTVYSRDLNRRSKHVEERKESKDEGGRDEGTAKKQNRRVKERLDKKRRK